MVGTRRKHPSSPFLVCDLCGGNTSEGDDKGLKKNSVVGDDELRVINTPDSLKVNYKCPSCSKRVGEVFIVEGERRGMSHILGGIMKDLVTQIKGLKSGSGTSPLKDHYIPLSFPPRENFLKVTGVLEQAILSTQQGLERLIQSGGVNGADEELLGFLRSLIVQIIRVGSIIPEVTKRLVNVKVEEYLQDQGVLIDGYEISSPDPLSPLPEVKEEQTDNYMDGDYDDTDLEMDTTGENVEDCVSNVSDDEDFEEDEDEDYIPDEDDLRGERGLPWWRRKYRCHLCQKGYAGKGLYLTHISSLGHREKVKDTEGLEELPQPAVQFICETCGKIHHSPTSLKLHVLSTHQIQGNPEICPHCGKGFKFPRNLKSHITRLHEERKYGCELCDKKFAERRERDTHLDCVHNGGIPAHRRSKKCPHCDQTFTKDRLTRHIARIHNPKGYLTCSQCDEKFGTLREKKIHERSDHKGLELFKCDKCGKVFPDKNHLTRHMITHTKVKDFQCEKCGDKFARMDGLTNHSRLNMCENPRVVKRRVNRIKKLKAEGNNTS